VPVDHVFAHLPVFAAFWNLAFGGFRKLLPGSLISLFSQVGAQLTLYDVAPVETGFPRIVQSESLSIMAAGVGEDGATTYVGEVVVNYEAEIFSDTTQSIVLTASLTNTCQSSSKTRLKSG
jgi:hypothetical protein